MKHWIVPLVVTGVAASVALYVASSQAQSSTRPAPVTARVAVCDVGLVFSKYLRREELTAQFNERRKATAAENDKQAQALEQMQKAIEQLKEGTKDFDARVAEFEQASIRYKNWREYQEALFVREHRKLTEEMYKEVLEAIAAVAKENGYDMVLYRDNVDLSSGTTTELLTKMTQRKCLYVDPALDITDMTTDRVNREYKARQPRK